MLNINSFEFILIAIAAVLLLGPKQLAIASRKLGQYYSKLTRYADDFKSAIDSAIEPINEINSEISTNRRSFIDQLKPNSDTNLAQVITSIPNDDIASIAPDDYLHPEFQPQAIKSENSPSDYLGASNNE